MCQILLSVLHVNPQNPMEEVLLPHFLDEETKHKGLSALKCLSMIIMTNAHYCDSCLQSSCTHWIRG